MLWSGAPMRDRAFVQQRIGASLFARSCDTMVVTMPSADESFQCK
ncbi:MAG: hypothetical protein QOJ04_3920 [Caballeronia sp.]|nr:hypothetical protein [Caballeronia sp.]